MVGIVLGERGEGEDWLKKLEDFRAIREGGRGERGRENERDRVRESERKKEREREEGDEREID